MSAIHANVHVTERAHTATVAVRDQRTAKPDVRDRRDDDRGVAVRRRDDRDHDRDRPVIVRQAPVVVESPVYSASWNPPASYSYQQAPLTLMNATALASSQVSINTTNLLAGATTLELESSGTGSTYVSQVVLYDSAGNYQVMNVNAMLSPSNPTVQIPLANGASLVRVAIDGHSDWGGAVALQAM